jgi:Fe-S-cluster containining protein
VQKALDCDTIYQAFVKRWIVSQQKIIEPLRKDLVIESTSGGKFEIRDAQNLRRITLDRRGFEVLSLLDKRQTKEELLQRIASNGNPMSPEALDRVLGVLMDLELLDVKQDEQETSLLIPRDLRFSCLACGSCCVGVNIGPVNEEVASVVREDLALLDTSGKPPFFVMEEDKEKERFLVCQSRNGACVFLDRDGLCRIHKQKGAQAKPWVCRVFPFRFVRTRRGIRVGLIPECRNMLRSFKGKRLCEQNRELEALLQGTSKLAVAPGFISLTKSKTISFEEYEAVEEEIFKAIRRSRKGMFCQLIEAWKIIVSRTGEGVSSEGITVEDTAHKLYSLVQEIAQRLVSLKGLFRQETGEIRFHSENLDMLVEALSDCPLYMSKILEDDPKNIRSFSKVILFNYLWSLEGLEHRSVSSALSWLAISWFFTKSLALSRAVKVHRFLLFPQDIVDAFICVHMLLRNHRVKKTLQVLEEKVEEIFGQCLPFLVGHGSEIEISDQKTDFHLF